MWSNTTMCTSQSTTTRFWWGLSYWMQSLPSITSNTVQSQHLKPTNSIKWPSNIWLDSTQLIWKTSKLFLLARFQTQPTKCSRFKFSPKGTSTEELWLSISNPQKFQKFLGTKSWKLTWSTSTTCNFLWKNTKEFQAVSLKKTTISIWLTPMPEIETQLWLKQKYLELLINLKIWDSTTKFSTNSGIPNLSQSKSTSNPSQKRSTRFPLCMKISPAISFKWNQKEKKLSRSCKCWPIKQEFLWTKKNIWSRVWRRKTSSLETCIKWPLKSMELCSKAYSIMTILPRRQIFCPGCQCETLSPAKYGKFKMWNVKNVRRDTTWVFLRSCATGKQWDAIGILETSRPAQNARATWAWPIIFA